jgi:hypothetical protein
LLAVGFQNPLPYGYKCTFENIGIVLLADLLRNADGLVPEEPIDALSFKAGVRFGWAECDTIPLY